MSETVSESDTETDSATGHGECVRVKKRRTSLRTLLRLCDEHRVVLKKRGIFIPDVPDDEECDTASSVAAGSTLKFAQHRKGNGTGNTKCAKKQLKAQHQVMMAKLEQHLQKLVDESEVDESKHQKGARNKGRGKKTR